MDNIANNPELSQAQRDFLEKKHKETPFNTPLKSIGGYINELTESNAPSEKDAQVDLLSQSIRYDDNKSADEINNTINEALPPPTPAAPQDLQNEKYEGSYLDQRRNTGVAYFDKKEHLSLMDAYLAKQLGLNVAYVFHKMDIKSDNTHRVTNQTKAVNDITRHLANAKNTMEILLQMGDQNTFSDALKMGLKNVTLGAIGNTKDYEIFKHRLKTNALTAFERKGQVFKQDLERIDKLTPAFNKQAGALALSKNILQESKHRINEALANYRYSGAHPEQIAYYDTQLRHIQEAEMILHRAQSENRNLNASESAKIMLGFGFAQR